LGLGKKQKRQKGKEKERKLKRCVSKASLARSIFAKSHSGTADDMLLLRLFAAEVTPRPTWYIVHATCRARYFACARTYLPWAWVWNFLFFGMDGGIDVLRLVEGG
jgi:hypothetical protein